MAIKTLLMKYEEVSKLLGVEVIGFVPRQDGTLEILYVEKKKEAQKK